MRPQFVALAIFLCAGCSRQDEDSQSIAGAGLIEEALKEPTVPVTSDSEIPDLVRKRLSRVTGEEFHVAPSESSAAETHADRAFIFAARSENYFTICYKVVSRSSAFGSRVITAATGPGENDGYGYLILVARCPADDVHSMSDLRKAFAAGKLEQYRPTFIDF